MNDEAYSTDKARRRTMYCNMKISYDAEIDALYLKLVEGNYECRTLQLTDEVALNIGENELLVGIEVLDAKEVLDSGNIPNIVLENIPFTVA